MRLSGILAIFLLVAGKVAMCKHGAGMDDTDVCLSVWRFINELHYYFVDGKIVLYYSWKVPGKLDERVESSI